MEPSKSIFFSVVIRVLVITVCIFFAFFRYISSERFNGIPPLIKAVGDVNKRKVRKLIARGVNLDVTDTEGNTGLYYGIQNGDVPDSIAIVMLLVLHHANVRARNFGGQTPLHLVDFIDDEGVRMKVLGVLIKQGANINAKTNRGYTLLGRLVEARDQAAIEKLIDKWGSLITLDTLNQAKKLADEFVFSEINDVLKKDIKVLGADGNVTARDQNGLDGLMLAVIRGDKKMVLNLIRRGASINGQSRDQFGYTPLHFSVLQENIALLETLLQQKANSNIKSKTGDAPLHLVTYIESDIQQKRSSELLLNYGADINLKNAVGDTIIHIAVRRNNLSLLKYLIDRFSININLNVKNNDGQTPESLAKRLERKDIIKLFNDLKKARQEVGPTRDVI